ncbi:MAG: 4Fe-4S binding protein [Firmicutes bacterium]|nr:4Fe-4S binding protein [Bacillota bacterium]
MKTTYLKTNRLLTPLRKIAWIFTLLVGIGGFFYPKLGLLVIPVMLTLTLMAFFKGRYWCGNFCPHGSLFDALLPLSKNQKIPGFLKSKWFISAVFVFFAVNLTRKMLNAFAAIGTPSFWDQLGLVFVTTYLMVIVAGTLLSLFISSRTWCSFCPMGLIQTISAKLGKLLGAAAKTDVKISLSHPEVCRRCEKCAKVCPMQLKPYLCLPPTNQFTDAACIKCAVCTVNCPAGILQLAKENGIPAAKESQNVKAV